MRLAFLSSMAAMAALCAPALAQNASYTWTGYGRSGGIGGSTSCSSYKMQIDVTVNGTQIKGLFQQQGRPQRNFEATTDAGGSFRAIAKVSGGTMNVKGTINATTATVVLDGYCKFDATLRRL